MSLGPNKQDLVFRDVRGIFKEIVADLRTDDEKSLIQLRNRYKWRRFSGCEKCQSKLMAYLEKGHSFDDVKDILHERHPEIKNIELYARRAIRQTTGLGLYDDYILEHNLWPLRSPFLIKDHSVNPSRKRALFEELWHSRAYNGRKLIDLERRLREKIDQDELIQYVTGNYTFGEGA